MWANFFEAGGWGMYPVSIFGFVLIAASVLYALRPERRTARLSLTLACVTLAAGLLGTSVGVCTTFLYLQQVEQAKQLQIAALGVQESLHNLVLALILAIVAGLLAAVGTLRGKDLAEA